MPVGVQTSVTLVFFICVPLPGLSKATTDHYESMIITIVT